jgi:hypothetical protein
LAKLNKTWIIDAFSQPYLKCFIDSGFGHPYILKIFPPGSTGVSNVNSIAENMLLNE